MAPPTANPESEENGGKNAIQRLSQGVTLSGVPSFSSLELKRQWMLEHLAGAFRVFARKGFVEGLTGHISLRDPGKNKNSMYTFMVDGVANGMAWNPEHKNCFWTNPWVLSSPTVLSKA